MVAYEQVTAEDDTHLVHNAKIVKKGSLLCAMINADEFNKIYNNATLSTTDRQQQLHTITNDVEDFVGAMEGIDLFEYFQPAEWFGNKNYGRAMIGAHWCKLHPEGVNDEVRTNISSILKDGGAAFQEEFFCVYPEAKHYLWCPAIVLLYNIVRGPNTWPKHLFDIIINRLVDLYIDPYHADWGSQNNKHFQLILLTPDYGYFTTHS